jgi:hypothetical protein
MSAVIWSVIYWITLVSICALLGLMSWTVIEQRKQDKRNF